jgi:hypothetical protein
MNETKPWYLSRTIWASLVTILLALAGLFEVPIHGVDGGELTDAVMQIVTALAGAAAIIGRLSARERIG